MKYVNGDLLDLAEDGKFEVIVHGCNCFCTMGAGIALQIKNRYPDAYSSDRRTHSGDKNKLGTYSISSGKDLRKFDIINAYTQYGYSRYNVEINYEAVRNVFRLVKKDFGYKRIGIPKIGCGLAGGNWNIIESIIDNEMIDSDITCVVFQ